MSVQFASATTMVSLQHTRMVSRFGAARVATCMSASATTLVSELRGAHDDRRANQNVPDSRGGACIRRLGSVSAKSKLIVSYWAGRGASFSAQLMSGRKTFTHVQLLS